jgi:hypothetical protein
VDLKMAQAGNDRGWEEEQKKRDDEDHWLELLQVSITTDYYYRLLLQTITTDYYYRILL